MKPIILIMKPIDSEHDFNQHGGKFWSHPTLNQNKVKVLGVAKKKKPSKIQEPKWVLKKNPFIFNEMKISESSHCKPVVKR